MSRRKQANPAKLGESDVATTDADAVQDAQPGTAVLPDGFYKKENAAAGEEEPMSSLDIDDDIRLDIKDEALDEDYDDNSLLNGQGSSPSCSSEQASPGSSSSLSDVVDGDEASTMGATATTPYECNICKRAFARSSLLSKHVQTHTEQLQFSCPYCRRLFKHKRSRDRHTKLHTGDKNYKCLHCDSAFARSDHLKIHMKTHDNKKPHQCELCNRGYNTAAALASHQQHHSKQEQRRCGSSASRSSAISSPSPGGSFRCLQCPDTFEKAELLQNHQLVNHKNLSASPVTSGAMQPTSIPSIIDTGFMMKSSNDLPKIACMYCGKDFLSMNHMYQHIHTEHRAIFNSISRSMNYTPLQSPEDLSPKQARQNNSPTYACDRCTMRFDSPVLLHEHVENVHWTTSSGLCCPLEKSPHSISNASQSKPTDLSRKRRATDSHHPLAEYQSVGDKQQRKADDPLKQSSPSAAGSPYDSNDKPCICSYCYAQMPNFKMFLLHMESHVAVNATSALPLATNSIIGCCPLCGEPARNALELGRHIFGHAIANVTARCCHCCKKPFDQMELLQKHLLESHSQTLYKCTICNELFDTQLTLQMHFTNKHSPECKHYRCNLCADQVFHDRLTAELHVNMKHSLQTPLANSRSYHLTRFPEVEQPRVEFPVYQCPFCQKAFKDEYLQYVHILKEHNDTREGENYLLEAASSTGRLLRPSASPNFSNYAKTASSPAEGKSESKGVNGGNYSCEICHRGDISSEAELAAHKKLHHAKSSKVSSVSLQCAYCNEHCKSRSDLENHMKSHQVVCGKGKHKCNICDEIFSTNGTLAEHKLSHCKIVAGNSCTQCKMVLVDENSFYNHQLQHSNSPTTVNKGPNNSQISLPANCIICCQTLQTDVEIKLHAKFHLRHLLQKQELVCVSCSKIICQPDGQSKQQFDKSNSRLCKECAAGANANGNYSPHHNALPHPDQKNFFACLKCPQTFESEEDVQNHAADHMINDEPNLECHLCRNLLPSPTKLQVHLIEHNFMGMGQYRCYVCSSVFTTAAGLRSHIIGHGLNHRPYECTDCKMKFFFETELENHKFVHFHLKSYTKNGAEVNYDKCVECKNCFSSVPENVYFTEHLRNCKKIDNHCDSVKVKIEDNVDFNESVSNKSNNDQ